MFNMVFTDTKPCTSLKGGCQIFEIVFLDRRRTSIAQWASDCLTPSYTHTHTHRLAQELVLSPRSTLDVITAQRARDRQTVMIQQCPLLKVTIALRRELCAHIHIHMDQTCVKQTVLISWDHLDLNNLWCILSSIREPWCRPAYWGHLWAEGWLWVTGRVQKMAVANNFGQQVLKTATLCGLNKIKLSEMQFNHLQIHNIYYRKAVTSCTSSFNNIYLSGKCNRIGLSHRIPNGYFFSDSKCTTPMWNIPHIKPPQLKYEGENYNVSSRFCGKCNFTA